MKQEDLIAPEDYNIVAEFERFNDDRKAIIWIDEEGNKKEITYRQLLQNANKIANAFVKSGLKQGNKVLIMIPRLIKAYEVYIAALKSGIVVIPSSEMLRANDIEYRLSHSEASAVISYYPYVDELEQVEQINQIQKFV